MPGENYGMAFVQPLGALQNMEIEAKKAPVELQHMEALTRNAQANAGAVEFATQMQKSGLEALKGFEFDQKDPVGSLLSMGSRVVTTQPVLAEKVMGMAALVAQRQATADAAKALEGKRMIELGRAKAEIIARAYGPLPSLSEEMLGMARNLVVKDMKTLGVSEAEINDAIATTEAQVRKNGPQAVEYFRQRSVSTYQALMAEHRKQMEEDADRRMTETERHNREVERARLAAEERLRGKLEDDAKAGKGNPKEPRPRLSSIEAVKTATALVLSDEVLGTGAPADKLKWARTIGQAAVEKVDASYAARMKNPNIPLVKMEDALREAADEVKARVKQDPSLFQQAASKVGVNLGAGTAKELQPKPGSPGLSDFLKKARAANPGVSDADLKAYWEKTHANR